MAQPTTQWFCDTCDQLISSANDGWVEWIHWGNPPNRSARSRGLRLVHHQHPSPQKNPGCQYDASAESKRDGGTLADDSLAHMAGPDGLMLVMALSDYGVPQAEIFEMIKRLFVPGYERARRHINAAIEAGEVEPNLPNGFHSQKDIDRTLAWATARGLNP